MKRINSILPLGIFILVLLASSCKKDDTPSVGFSMKATGANTTYKTEALPRFGSSADAALPLDWNTAWIYVNHLTFSAEYYGLSDLLHKGDLPNVNIEWQGNQKIDLLATPFTFGKIEIPQGNFKQFELTMTSARLGYANEPNFFLSGIYGPVFGGTPISVSVTQEFEMKLSYDGEDNISTNDSYLFEGLITLSLDKVFSGITADDLNKAERTNGWILISAEHNQGLYAKILENLNTTAESSYTWGLHTIN
jgi:hypothetical protein